MKNPAIKLLLTLSIVSIVFHSCKKDDKKDDQLDSQVQQFNADSQNYKGESDQADSDINNALGEIPAFGRFTTTLSSPLCGVTIDSSQIAQKILFFNFDGITPCFSPSRTRDGQIKVQLTSGAYWSDVNSVLTITYINFKVTRLSDNKSIQFNGVKTLQNVNGHNWFGFLSGTATHKYRERALNINVTFDNGSTATWNSARTTEWSFDSAPAVDRIVFTANGDTTINGLAAIDSWGVNRFGQVFTTHYNAAWVSNTYCGLWRPNSGQLTHLLNNASYILTLGVDQGGNPTPYQCAYGFKVQWNSSAGTIVRVFSY